MVTLFKENPTLQTSCCTVQSSGCAGATTTVAINGPLVLPQICQFAKRWAHKGPGLRYGTAKSLILLNSLCLLQSNVCQADSLQSRTAGHLQCIPGICIHFSSLHNFYYIVTCCFSNDNLLVRNKCPTKHHLCLSLFFLLHTCTTSHFFNVSFDVIYKLHVHVGESQTEVATKQQL